MFSYQLKNVARLADALQYFNNKYRIRAIYVVIREHGKVLLNAKLAKNSAFFLNTLSPFALKSSF
jgi:hypothetical protein